MFNALWNFARLFRIPIEWSIFRVAKKFAIDIFCHLNVVRSVHNLIAIKSFKNVQTDNWANVQNDKYPIAT